MKIERKKFQRFLHIRSHSQEVGYSTMGRAYIGTETTNEEKSQKVTPNQVDSHSAVMRTTNTSCGRLTFSQHPVRFKSKRTRLLLLLVSFVYHLILFMSMIT